MRAIVLDIETQNTFEEVASADPGKLAVSLAVAYEYATDTYHSFWEQELDKLWPLLEQAERIIGYNLDYFDMPVLNRYYRGNLMKLPTLDLLLEIKKSLGRRVSLNAVATGTLGTQKSGHGLDAVRWWRAGELDKIKKYCIDDVRLTKEVYEYALKNQSVKISYNGQSQTVRLDTSRWERTEPKSVNYTLPF